MKYRYYGKDGEITPHYHTRINGYLMGKDINGNQLSFKNFNFDKYKNKIVLVNNEDEILKYYNEGFNLIRSINESKSNNTSPSAIKIYNIDTKREL